VTGRRSRELLRQKADHEKSADIDVSEIRREAYAAAFEPAWKAGAEWAFNVLREAGLDVDSVLALDDDDHQGDEPAGDE
jgi:hypothetical protein